MFPAFTFLPYYTTTELQSPPLNIHQFMLKFLSLLTVFAFYTHCLHAKASDKTRIIVTTDLGGSDPDDIQSMIHLLVCSDRIDIEGLISAQAWVDDPDKTDKLKDVVNKFGAILPNLASHSKDFPTIDYLNSIIARGQSKAHMAGVGAGKDSPGSDLIIKAVDKKDDNRPIWLTAWGGMNTIAQALWKVQHTRNATDVEKFTNKIRIYDILGQDDAGAWIAKNFPDIIYIRNKHVYGWAPDDEWTKNNIQNCQPLGKCYPNRIWATEGDSPAFLYMYANGLNVPEHMDYGGWGGRFSTIKNKNIRGMDFIVKSGKNETIYDDYYMHTSEKEGSNAIARWKEHIWNDFAARMLWSTTPNYDSVNHHPIAAIDKDRTTNPIFIKAKAGKEVTFNAGRSFDPDKDEINYRWYIYEEPSTCKETINIDGNDTPQCRLVIPSSITAGNTIHLILEITDNGKPALTSYKRVIIEII